MVNKWTVTAVAALALMAVVLATALPAWAQNDNGLERDYAENGADPVATFTAVDPEGRTVYWDLLVELPVPAPTVDGTALVAANIADHGDFSISMDGVLTFRSPPSFESPNGGQIEAAEVTPIATGSTFYNIVVVSYDDAFGATSSPLPVTGETRVNRNAAYHKVTVKVTDEDEDGSISLSGLQPQAGVAFTAALKDDDASDTQITAAKWKWEQSSAMDGPWTLISGETDDEYTPASDVVGMYLQATATYTDEHGDDKTAMAVTAHMVRATPSGGNAAPVFPDTDGTAGADEQSRTVKENSPQGYRSRQTGHGWRRWRRADLHLNRGQRRWVPNRPGNGSDNGWDRTESRKPTRSVATHCHGQGYRPVRRPQRCECC